MKNQNGQIVIILLMTMLVGLAVGLVVTQRSLTDVSTSTQTEQASRAFSAAEAGLEKALSQTGTSSDIPSFQLGNESAANVRVNADIPENTGCDNGGPCALEYPPIGRETIAQFWLANPEGLNIGSPAGFYTTNKFELYFGDLNEESKALYAATPAEKPAIAVNVVTFNGTSYVSNRYYYDSDSTRASGNGFIPARDCSIGGFSTKTNNASSLQSSFYCKVSVPPGSPTDCGVIKWKPYSCNNNIPVMVRARFLYSSGKHPVALKPLGGRALPPQASIFVSTGTAGQSQKRVKAFRLKHVVPPFFDFAIFSLGNIEK